MKIIILISTVLIFSFSICISQSLPNYVATDDLMAWWSFEGDAVDLSQNGHDGLVSNVIYDVDNQGSAGSSAFFNGTNNSYIQVNHSNDLNFTGTDDYTIALRIKAQNNPTNGPHAGILSKWNESLTTSSYPYRVATTDLGNGTSELVWINFDNSTGTQTEITHIIPNNRYMHIAYVIKNNTAHLYVNGYLETSIQFPNLDYSNSDDVYIGKRNVVSSRNYHGNLDEMGIWSRALNECEVRSLVSFYDVNDFEFDVVNNGNGEMEVINLGSTPDSFQWYECFNGSPVAISGENSSTYESNSSNGFYAVEVSFSNPNCSNLSECFEMQTLSVEDSGIDKYKNIDFAVYPNPTTKYLNVDIQSENTGHETQFKIIDITGKLVLEGNLDDKNQINIESLNKGTYFIKLSNYNETLKFVKN